MYKTIMRIGVFATICLASETPLNGMMEVSQLGCNLHVQEVVIKYCDALSRVNKTQGYHKEYALKDFGHHHRTIESFIEKNDENGVKFIKKQLKSCVRPITTVGQYKLIIEGLELKKSKKEALMGAPQEMDFEDIFE